MSFLDRLTSRRQVGPLTPDGLLASELWLDQRNALRKIRKKERRKEPPEVFASERILERDGCRGFDSPLHVHATRLPEEAEPAAVESAPD
ncbi:MAG: hypothetical protein GY719_03410 [bacterium]|nr:hypothetical protein [bacterium]